MKIQIPIALAMLSIGLGVPPVSASPMNPQPSTTISLAGRNVMRINAGAGGYTAGERAEIVRHRLDRVISMPGFRPTDIQARRNDATGQVAVFARKQLLVTVGPKLARANDSTRADLARTWVLNLRDTLPMVATNPAAHHNLYMHRHTDGNR